jgi:hypothetical protein
MHYTAPVIAAKPGNEAALDFPRPDSPDWRVLGEQDLVEQLL